MDVGQQKNEKKIKLKQKTTQGDKNHKMPVFLTLGKKFALGAELLQFSVCEEMSLHGGRDA